MRKKIKINKEVLQKMEDIYYSEGKDYLDWMGFKITDVNKPSYHHIEKAEDLRNKNESDIATIENGAYLGKKSHELLHKIEYLDKDLYDSWNYIFSVINKMKVYPIEDIWKMIAELQIKTFNVVNSKTKVLKK